jgi:hypothetical protein
MDKGLLKSQEVVDQIKLYSWNMNMLNNSWKRNIISKKTNELIREIELKLEEKERRRYKKVLMIIQLKFGNGVWLFHGGE